MKLEKVCFCVNRQRPNEYIGGGSGVMRLLEYYLRKTDCMDKILFLYRDSSKARYFRELLEITRNDEIYPICHDPGSAAALSALGRRYSLVYHQQGPLVQEYLYLLGGKKKGTILKKRMVDKLALTGAEKVYFPSTGAKEMYFGSKYAATTPNNVQLGGILYNSINTDETPDPIEGIERDDSYLTILTVGSMTRLKGQDLSCDFIENILKQWHLRIRWITLGEGPIEEEVNFRCENLEKKYANFKYSHFRKLPHANVLYLDQISDIYLMLHRSSIFDLATLEAMNGGCLPVLSNIGGNKDFNIGNNCILVDSDNLNDGVKNIMTLDINHLKRKNRQIFRNYFSPECFVSRYLDVINSIIV